MENIKEIERYSKKILQKTNIHEFFFVSYKTLSKYLTISLGLFFIFDFKNIFTGNGVIIISSFGLMWTLLLSTIKYLKTKNSSKKVLQEDPLYVAKVISMLFYVKNNLFPKNLKIEKIKLNISDIVPPILRALLFPVFCFGFWALANSKLNKEFTLNINNYISLACMIFSFLILEFFNIGEFLTLNSSNLEKDKLVDFLKN